MRATNMRTGIEWAKKTNIDGKNRKIVSDSTAVINKPVNMAIPQTNKKPYLGL